MLPKVWCVGLTGVSRKEAQASIREATRAEDSAPQTADRRDTAAAGPRALAVGLVDATSASESRTGAAAGMVSPLVPHRGWFGGGLDGRGARYGDC